MNSEWRRIAKRNAHGYFYNMKYGRFVSKRRPLDEGNYDLSRDTRHRFSSATYSAVSVASSTFYSPNIKFFVGHVQEGQ